MRLGWMRLGGRLASDRGTHEQGRPEGDAVELGLPFCVSSLGFFLPGRPFARRGLVLVTSSVNCGAEGLRDSPR
jgi:hypothetical protein